jgi:hypothetical protein
MHLSAKRCKVSIDKTKKFALHKSQANWVIQRIKFLWVYDLLSPQWSIKTGESLWNLKELRSR